MITKGLFKHEKTLFLLPVLLTVFVFFQIYEFESILYDDPIHLYENENITSGVTADALQWAFTETAETNLWHPVTWVSYMLDVELFGIEEVGLHHLVNLAAHVVASALLYFILLHYFKNPWLALIFCCLWAIHPHRVQNVAWISQRKDVLCMSFMLGSWLTWLYSGKELRSPMAWGALALFTLSIMSKPSSIGLPLVLLASEFLLRGSVPKKSRNMLGLFIAVSITSACLTIYFQKQGNLADLDQTLPLMHRLLHLPFTAWWYVKASFLSNGALWVYTPTDTWSLYLQPIIGLLCLGFIIFKLSLIHI